MNKSAIRRVWQLDAIDNIKKKNLREKILQELAKDPETYRLIKDICLNCVHGNLPLNPSQKRSLRRHKSCLVDLASKKTKNKRKRIKQFGSGILTVLLPTLATLAADFLGKKFTKQ